MFTEEFRNGLTQLLRWRRDVRHFRRQPLAEGILEELLELACLAPSVGLSEPWRFVIVESPERRAAVKTSFAAANAEALSGYSGEKAKLYSQLKLAGMDDAPVHLAVLADPGTEQGSGLGRRTMPETMAYSAVCAVHTLWLAARARGVGVGWVSILDPNAVAGVLEIPETWELIAYLCLGYPEQDASTPELERAGWEHRSDWSRSVLRR